LEVEEVGKVKDSVNIPFVLAFRAYDSEERKKVVKKEPNPEFVQQVSFLLAGGMAWPDRSITAAQSHQQAVMSVGECCTYCLQLTGQVWLRLSQGWVHQDASWPLNMPAGSTIEPCSRGR
jgi:hypothetical protein